MSTVCPFHCELLLFIQRTLSRRLRIICLGLHHYLRPGGPIHMEIEMDCRESGISDSKISTFRRFLLFGSLQ